MSEEEIKEIVIQIKNHQIAVFEPTENIQVTRNYFTEKQRQAIQGLLDLYNKEKEKNKQLEKNILQDTSYSMITRLEMKLKYDIEQIDKKLTSDEYINDYRIARLKGIRTKCKELLKLLEERN